MTQDENFTLAVENERLYSKIADLERQLAEACDIITEVSDIIYDETCNYERNDEFRIYLEAIHRRSTEFIKKNRTATSLPLPSR